MTQTTYIYNLLKKKLDTESERCIKDPNRSVERVSILFPFKDRIDTIDIDIYINVNNNGCLWFMVYADSLYDKEDAGDDDYVIYCSILKNIDVLTEKDVENLIIEINDFVENNYFDKRNCAIYPFKNICNGKGVRGGDCSVCLEKTKTKTNCNHSLCLECFQSIVVVNSDCEGKKCPICREIHTYLVL